MLDDSKKMPLYMQLADTLRQQLQENLKPNDKLATENEICEEYSVSRTTVRLALSQLEKEGAIYRIQGKGSFVSAIESGGLNSFFEVDLRSHFDGIDPEDLTVEVLKAARESPQLMLIRQMGLQPREKIIRVKLLYKVKETPAAIETIILRANHFIGVRLTNLDEMQINKAISEIAPEFRFVNETYKIQSPDKKEQQILNDSVPVLVITKSMYDTNNELIIMSERKVNTSRFSYVNFFRNGNP